jgi:hypothetical protein
MKIKLKDVLYYLQGNVRYQIFYSNFAWLLRAHVRQQITVRINSMDQECYDTGSCKECGCNTTHLQCCDKACEANCYPAMLNEIQWAHLIAGKYWFDPKTKIIWGLRDNKFYKMNK